MSARMAPRPTNWEDTDDIPRSVMPLLRRVYSREHELGLAVDVPDFDAWLCSRLDLPPGALTAEHAELLDIVRETLEHFTAPVITAEDIEGHIPVAPAYPIGLQETVNALDALAAEDATPLCSATVGDAQRIYWIDEGGPE